MQLIFWLGKKYQKHILKPLLQTVWRFLKELKIELPYDPGYIQLLGIYPKKTKTLIQKDISASMFITALFTIAKKWKQPKCPSAATGLRRCGYIYIWNIYVYGIYIYIYIKYGI